MSTSPKKSQLTVLIVDDDPLIRMQANGFLAQAGFIVKEAEEAQSALRLVEKTRPDLILLDVEMPGMNGFDLCKMLRARKPFRLTPIMMLTGNGDNESIDQAYVAGATDFATKPINWTLLTYRLRYMYRSSIVAEQLSTEKSNHAAAQKIAQLGYWKYSGDSHRISCSEQLLTILGLPKQCNEFALRELIAYVHKEDIRRVINWLKAIRENHRLPAIDFRVVLRCGTIKSVRQQVDLNIDHGGQAHGALGILQDFTERKKVEEKVEQLAYYDTLTGLPNRLLFNQTLEQSIHLADQTGNALAVIYLDLDDFKRINDSLGHEIGDRLLSEVGSRLRSELCPDWSKNKQVGGSHTVARIGGDEFAIILYAIAGKDQIEYIAKNITTVVSAPYCVDGYQLFTSPSMGIALYPQKNVRADTLLKNADMAMCEAKRLGKNIHRVHSYELDNRAKKRFEMDVQMRSALKRDEFSIHYQPQLNLVTGEIYSTEALLRWNNAELGYVPPNEFIPVAEDSGMILEIGEWVLRAACKQAKYWLDTDFIVNQVAVNISAIQFVRPDFTETVESILREVGLPPEKLELEITESVLAADIKDAIATLEKLNSVGVVLSIDDFGTGYSSLSQLKMFPVNRLKIDKSFIDNIAEDKSDTAIATAIIDMCKSIGLNVLAEGIETQQQLNILSANGCDEIQGYLIGRPQASDDLSANMDSTIKNLREILESTVSLAVRKAS